MPESTPPAVPLSDAQVSALLYEWMHLAGLLRKVNKTNGEGRWICHCCGSFNRPPQGTDFPGINWAWQQFHPSIKTIPKENGVIIPDKAGALLLSWNEG